jgi:hypothetical protein
LGNEKGIGHGAWSMERSDMRTRRIVEAEMRRQRAEDRRQKTEDRRQKTENSL